MQILILQEALNLYWNLSALEIWLFSQRRTFSQRGTFVEDANELAPMIVQIASCNSKMFRISNSLHRLQKLATETGAFEIQNLISNLPKFTSANISNIAGIALSIRESQIVSISDALNAWLVTDSYRLTGSNWMTVNLQQWMAMTSSKFGHRTWSTDITGNENKQIKCRVKARNLSKRGWITDRLCLPLTRPPASRGGWTRT